MMLTSIVPSSGLPLVLDFQLENRTSLLECTGTACSKMNSYHYFQVSSPSQLATLGLSIILISLIQSGLHCLPLVTARTLTSFLALSKSMNLPYVLMANVCCKKRAPIIFFLIKTFQWFPIPCKIKSKLLNLGTVKLGHHSTCIC